MNGKHLEDQIISFVRAFGLHKSGETPCGKPLSIAEAYVLMELSADKQLPQQLLVERLNLAKSTVSRLLKHMLKREWVNRERDLHDGRAWVWRLTEKGEILAADVAEARRKKYEQILAHIPPDSQAIIFNSLNLLVEAINESTKRK